MICDTVVTGTATSPTDWETVNAADNGPQTGSVLTVCLEGTFDFGAADRLVIQPDPAVDELNIVGIGPDKPTILGGNQTFSLPQGSLLQRLCSGHFASVLGNVEDNSVTGY